MKTQKFYVVVFAMRGDSAEAIDIVKAHSLKELKNKGFRKTKEQDVFQTANIEEAESFCKKYAGDYPKHRICYV